MTSTGFCSCTFVYPKHEQKTNDGTDYRHQTCFCNFYPVVPVQIPENHVRSRKTTSADVHINIALTSNGLKWISVPSLYANDSFAFCFWKAIFSLQVWFMLHVYFEKETSYQILKMSLHNYFRIFMPLLIWVVKLKYVHF